LNSKRKILIAIIIGVIFMTLAISYSINDQRQLETFNEEYFESFNESFEGQITEVVNEYQVHTCMLYIDLTNATTEKYDVREATDNYYTVIRNNRAEVIEHVIYEHDGTTQSKNLIRANDYFIFDGQKDSAFLYRDNELIQKWKPLINDFELVTIRKKHKIEK
jgi:hypothetical protein